MGKCLLTDVTHQEHNYKICSVSKLFKKTKKNKDTKKFIMHLVQKDLLKKYIIKIDLFLQKLL